MSASSDDETKTMENPSSSPPARNHSFSPVLSQGFVLSKIVDEENVSRPAGNDRRDDVDVKPEMKDTAPYTHELYPRRP